MSKFHKQLVLHDPASGKWGDCYRTCIAALLGLHPSSVPHFLDRGPKPAKFWADIEGWLAKRGLYQININFDGSASLNLALEAAAQGSMLYMVSGMSPRGYPHTVVCRGNRIVHDPHPSDGGLDGPLDGYWQVAYLGVLADKANELARAAA